MTARTFAVAVTCIVAGAAALPAAQQAPTRPGQAPVFRSSTELVEIDVVVVDSDGRRVRNLTKDDFILRDRDIPQTIETFTEVRRDDGPRRDVVRAPVTARNDVASNTNAHGGRLVVLVLDDLHVWQGRTDVVKDIARNLLKQLDPDSSMALLQTGGDHSTEVTNDRAQLLESIERFKGRRPVRRPLEHCNLAPIKRSAERPEDFDPGCDIQNAYSNISIVETLKEASTMLGRNDRRRKAFILVSESSAGDLTGLFDGGTGIPGEFPDSAAYLAGNPAGLGAPSGVSHRFEALHNMLTAMRRANVATYAIDPRGLVTRQQLMHECHPGSANRNPQELSAASPIGPDPCEGDHLKTIPQSWGSWVRQAQSGLKIIAEATGGFAVVDTDDFATGIDQIVDDIDNFYLLGFYTQDVAARGYRPVDVEVRGRPDLTLRYRRGYEIRVDDVAKNAKRDALNVLVDNPLPSSDLPMRLHAIPMPHAGNRARVAVSLEMTLPRASMTTADSDRLLDDIRYGLYAIDLKGAKVREHIGSGARVALRPRAGVVTLPDKVTYQLALELELPAGRYQLRASALSEKLNAGGSVYLSVDVPDFSKADLALTDLLVAFADGPRVPVARDRRQLGPVKGAVNDAATSPMNPALMGRPTPTMATPLVAPVQTANALPFEPSLDRVFQRSDALLLYFKAVQSGRRDLVATVSALAANGRPVISLERRVPEDGGLAIRLPLAQLRPGGYQLQVEVSDGARVVAKDVGFAVR